MSEDTYQYCGLAAEPPPVFPPGLGSGRLAALINGVAKWVNGTVLHYYFFDRDTDGSTVRFPDGSTRFVSWVGPQQQRDVVRESMRAWENLGIGIRFKEVHDRAESELRIGFMQGDGSYSVLGRTALQVGSNSRTINYGWDLTTLRGRATALHEIGHALGMPHEHQSPFAGIEWDEEAVYTYFAGPPNEWPREKTYHNVIRKLDPAEVTGSSWDFLSIMEYSFRPGLIRKPEEYTDGLITPGTLSTLDTTYIRQWYPALSPAGPPPLVPFQSVQLDLAQGDQADFSVIPDATRTYTISTFGDGDAVLVLFEDVDGEARYLAGDDDGGHPRNAALSAHLLKDRRYLVRVRLYSSWGTGQIALMCW